MPRRQTLFSHSSIVQNPDESSVVSPGGAEIVTLRVERQTMAYVVLPDFSVTAAFNQFESVNDPELLLSSLITEV